MTWEPEQPKPKHPSQIIREEREADVRKALEDGRGALVREFMTPAGLIARRWANGALTTSPLPAGSDTRGDGGFYTR